MEYAIIYDGNSYDLPTYSFSIAEKIEKQESINASNQKFKDKCKAMYELVVDILGKDTVNSILGDFAKADPNVINILYLKIVSSYNKPVTSFNVEDTEKMMDSIPFDKLTDMMELVNTIDKLKK